MSAYVSVCMSMPELRHQQKLKFGDKNHVKTRVFCLCHHVTVCLVPSVSKEHNDFILKGQLDPFPSPSDTALQTRRPVHFCYNTGVLISP